MDERRGESLHDLVGELLSLLDDGAHRVEVASEIENLERLHDEIETAVAEAQATPEGVLGRLQNVLRRLEVAHPDATALIGRISSALSELGI